MPKAQPDLCFYHWSPVERRAGIKRRGFVPGSQSLAREWRPPFTCFADEPKLAWQLSGRIHPEFTDWDLWMVFACDVPRFEVIFDTFPDTGRSYPKEYRVYERILKSKIWYVATRSSTV